MLPSDRGRDKLPVRRAGGTDDDDDGGGDGAAESDASEKQQRCHRTKLQGSAKIWALGLVNFVLVVAYHFCLALPATFTQPGVHL